MRSTLDGRIQEMQCLRCGKLLARTRTWCQLGECHAGGELILMVHAVLGLSGPDEAKLLSRKVERVNLKSKVRLVKPGRP